MYNKNVFYGWSYSELFLNKFGNSHILVIVMIYMYIKNIYFE